MDENIVVKTEKNVSIRGPIAERKQGIRWRSVHGEDGGHYNVFALSRGKHSRVDDDEEQMSMDALRALFENGEADELNFCLFSTSGVHGLYCPIEDAERWIKNGCPDYSEDDTEWPDDEIECVTFLVVQPRLVTLRYGNVYPKTLDDIAFLKRLRETSWAVVQTIGRPE